MRERAGTSLSFFNDKMTPTDANFAKKTEQVRSDMDRAVSRHVQGSQYELITTVKRVKRSKKEKHRTVYRSNRMINKMPYQQPSSFLRGRHYLFKRRNGFRAIHFSVNSIEFMMYCLVSKKPYPSGASLVRFTASR